MPGARVVVVGGGVCGLSCAHELLDAGHEVEIWAEALPGTTSTVAAAFWYPFRADPPDRVSSWAARSWTRFAALCEVPGAGVRMRDALDVHPDRVEPPPWMRSLPGFRPARGDELPPGRGSGAWFRAPVIETPVYLPWLVERVRARGGQFRRHTLRSLDEARHAAPIVVDAAGLGARELVGDPELVPIRGQVVVVRARGIETVLVDEHGPDGLTYVVPRTDDVVLGGTVEAGREDTAVDPATSRAILARCRRLVPALANAEPILDKVGLRPGRSRVRLEIESRPGGIVVHDYGHGGAGVTLSWGCAEEVRSLIAAALGAERTP
jgi:D-amino-acid oxidase